MDNVARLCKNTDRSCQLNLVVNLSNINGM